MSLPDNGLLQSNADRIGGIPHIMDYHVQENVARLQLFFLLLKRLLGQLVNFCKATKLLENFEIVLRRAILHVHSFGLLKFAVDRTCLSKFFDCIKGVNQVRR